MMSVRQLEGVAQRQWTARSGATELAVFEWGNPDGEPVVLVHGWPDTHVVWSSVVPLLSDRFRVIAYDTRGAGGSSAPKAVSAYRLDKLAADFFAVIDAASPNVPVHVVAHDWGSIQVWEAVCTPRSNRRVASFTSISGPSLDHLAMWMRGKLAAPTPRSVRAPILQIISSLCALLLIVPVLPRLLLKIFGTERMWTWLLGRVEGIPADDVHVADTLQHDMITGLKIYRANVLQHVLRPRQRYTTVPIQILVSTRDVAIRPAGYDALGRWASSVQRHDIPAGHWLPFSEPLVVAEAAANFIDSLTLATAS